jgi:glycosyltransferase involved in cell wall biosynthesis
MPMARILFVHNNFPGQFAGVAPALARRGHRCAAIGSSTARAVDGMALAQWNTRRGTTQGIWPDAIRAEADLIRGRAAAAAAVKLKEKGFEPDVIVGHPGWGETVFLREIFPGARQVLLAEFYYRTKGGDWGFDPEFGAQDLAASFRVHAKNATLAMSYADADRLVCPTPFQASMLPASFRPQVRIIHEGVDTARIKADPNARLTLPDGRVLDRTSEIVTFVNRNLEPLRGFHVFMRALPAFLEARPEAQVVIIGSETGPGYGPTAPDGTTWKSRLLAEVGDRLDARRVHFLGRVPPETLHAAFSLAAAHVYYTYPFVLSWSLLEAMACGCLVVGSDTAPVRDVVVDGGNGLLRDFFDAEALSRTLIEACARPEAFQSMRQSARETVVTRFDRPRVCLPAWISTVEDLC